MRKILIFGKNGQVASSIYKQNKNFGFQLFFLDSNSFDFADKKNLLSIIKKLNPSLIINAAAYNLVDSAEENQSESYLANATGPKYISEICEQLNLILIHISTDYVFGKSHMNEPLKEEDPKFPIGVYSKSKLKGENDLINEKKIILRVSWVFSSVGENFLLSMIKLANKEKLDIVSDHFGSPTSAMSIAKTILTIAKKIFDTKEFSSWGVYHFSGYPYCSWHEFASEIFNQMSELKFIEKKPILNQILSKDYAYKIERPLYSCLNCEKIFNEFSIEMDDWKKAVRIYLAEIYEN